MTISGVSSCSGYDPKMQPLDSRFTQIRQAFDNLGNALQSGNLSDAQSAYSALTSLRTDSAAQGQSGQRATDPNNPIANDLAEVGKALQSGDLSAAQSAFQKVQQDATSLRRRAHHHHHPQVDPSQSTAASVTGATTARGTDSDGDNDGSTRSRVNELA